MMGRIKIIIAAGLFALSPAMAVAQSDMTTASPAPVDAAAPAASAATSQVAKPSVMAPEPGIGQPVPKGYELQQTFTPIGAQGRILHDKILMPIITAITIFVLGLLLWAMFRYRAKANPVPSKTSHNTLIEVLWTAVPVLILLVIAVPSFALLSNQYDPPKPDLTIKVTGHQWYWSYEYPDQGGFSFDAVMLTDEEAVKAGEPKKLAVDNRVVVPAGAAVKLLITSEDVIHSFALPSFWVKMDAVPGRINETWFKVDRPGVYYGQCSELCGTRHAFMPIAIEVLPRDQFNAWVAAKQAENGIAPVAPAPAAAAAAAAPAVPVSAPAAAPATAAAI